MMMSTDELTLADFSGGSSCNQTFHGTFIPLFFGKNQIMKCGTFMGYDRMTNQQNIDEEPHLFRYCKYEIIMGYMGLS
jgi:hypothetical protein